MKFIILKVFILNKAIFVSVSVRPSQKLLYVHQISPTISHPQIIPENYLSFTKIQPSLKISQIFQQDQPKQKM